MKRSIPLALVMIYSLLLFLLYSCSPGLPPKTAEEKEREQMAQNGIKTITQTKVAFFAGVRQPDQITQVKEYNQQGLLFKETDYRTDGTPDCVLSFGYGSDGQLTQYTALNENNEFLYQVTKSYDADRKLKELYFHLPGGTYKYRTVATYDNKGRLSEYAWYWTTGIKARNVYSYHGWNKVSDKEYDPQGRLNYEWSYRYDKSGNLLAATQVNSEGKISRRITNEYNHELLMKQTSFVEEAVQKSVLYTYDTNGLLSVMSEFNSSGKKTATFIYLYEYWK